MSQGSPSISVAKSGAAATRVGNVTEITPWAQGEELIMPANATTSATPLKRFNRRIILQSLGTDLPEQGWCHAMAQTMAQFGPDKPMKAL